MASNEEDVKKLRQGLIAYTKGYYDNICKTEHAKAERCIKQMDRLKEDMNRLREDCQNMATDFIHLERRRSMMKQGNMELKAEVARRQDEMKDVVYLDTLINHLNDVGDKMKLVPLVVDADIKYNNDIQETDKHDQAANKSM